MTWWIYINRIQNCLRIPYIICKTTCVKARCVLTPLNFHKHFLVYIRRHLNYTFHIFFSGFLQAISRLHQTRLELNVPYFVVRISYYCVLLLWISFSVLFSTIGQLVVKNLFVDLRFITIIQRVYLSYFVFVQSVAIYFIVYKDKRGYSHLKEEAMDRTMWRNRFGRGFGPVVRQNTEWMNECIYSIRDSQ
jgi:hypothetical protein